uniref:Uncharacterized protein n=1 Tax=Arundo donax TaxID=35708 RepID=A0A0A9BY13_ARUDO
MSTAALTRTLSCGSPASDHRRGTRIRGVIMEYTRKHRRRNTCNKVTCPSFLPGESII